MSDVFIEYLVKRKNTPRIMAMKAGAMFATLLFTVACFMLSGSGVLGPFSMFATIAVFGAIYGMIYFISGLNVEFEYAVTNGELDVDKIMAKRKRKRLATVNCRQVEAFGRYKPAEHAQKQYQTRIIACDSEDSGDVWYLTARIRDKGLTLVVFNANEKMLNAIKPFLPAPIMHEAFRVGA